MKTSHIKSTLFFCMAIVFSTTSLAIDVHPVKEDVKAPKKEYSPYVDDHFPNNV